MITNYLFIGLVLQQAVWGDFPTSNDGPAGSKFSEAAHYSNNVLAAFVDVNNDRRVDTIVVSNDQSIYVLLEPDARDGPSIIIDTTNQNLPTQVKLLDAKAFPGLTIRSIVSGDFNGDSVADLLVFTSSSVERNFQSFICYGSRTGNSWSVSNPIVSETFLTQPIIGDFNGDGIVDIYGLKDSTHRSLVLGGKDLLPRLQEDNSKFDWFNPGYCAFGDFDQDSIGGSLVMGSLNGGKLQIQYFPNSMTRTKEGFPDVSNPKYLDLPQILIDNSKTALVGQFRVADFTRDGNLDLLLPFCTSQDCVDSGHVFIYEFKSGSWSEVTLFLNPVGAPQKGKWSFTPYDAKMVSLLNLSSSLLSGITHGDVDLDSWLDLTAILTYTYGSEKYKVPAILKNSGFTRGSLQFQAYLLPNIAYNTQEIIQMAFFDQNEDGVLDVWITTRDVKTDALKTRLLMQSQSNNNYFLMVMVLNGLCNNRPTCMGYGIPFPGSSASYETYSIDGDLFKVSGVTSPLASCTALELPYLLFGTGELANYIEKVTARILSSDGKGTLLQHSMEFIVPDSQLVINPSPRTEVSDWKVTLFLQPLRNMKVLFIAITLFAVMLLLAIVISIMQCLEIREDREEKKRESQGFHF